jgi:hypothetical protein
LEPAIVEDAVRHEKPDRTYRGASAIGHPCDRKLWYDFHWVSRRSIDVRGYTAIADGRRSICIIPASIGAIGQAHARRRSQCGRLIERRLQRKLILRGYRIIFADRIPPRISERVQCPARLARLMMAIGPKHCNESLDNVSVSFDGSADGIAAVLSDLVVAIDISSIHLLLAALDRTKWRLLRDRHNQEKLTSLSSFPLPFRLLDCAKVSREWSDIVVEHLHHCGAPKMPHAR